MRLIRCIDKQLGFACGWLLLDRKDLFPFIIAAVRTDMMGQAHLMAIGAGNQVGGFHRQVAAPAITPSFRDFPFWQRWHGVATILSVMKLLNDTAILTRRVMLSVVADAGRSRRLCSHTDLHSNSDRTADRVRRTWTGRWGRAGWPAGCFVARPR